MAPRIRSIGSYATQGKFSVDFFGDEFIVTVTSDPSVIGQWIHDVLRFSSRPLVVGVGVQWTPHPTSPPARYHSPVSYHSDSSPVTHHYDSPPVCYRSDSPPAQYCSVSPPARYSSDSPPAQYRSVSPPAQYRSVSPPALYRSVSPPARYRSVSPPVRYRSDSPPAQFRSVSPPARYLSDSPLVRYRSVSPPARYLSVSPPARYRSVSPPACSDPPANTLQLCVGNRCIIIQLFYCNRVPHVLRRFLGDRNHTFVGFWNSQDAGKLKRSRHRLEIAELLDLRNHVVDSRGRGLKGCSFEVVVGECLGYRGVRLEKAIGMSDWSVYDLSYDQILQASIDVYVCSKLGFRNRLWEF
ncbi:putative 3'-5' exonuclease domain, ribonuclease H-like superfamily [Arabidopsis thaliana]